MAHSSAAGPGRPVNIARMASHTRRGASLGEAMRAEKSTRRETMPLWSRISCKWPSPRPIAAWGIWPMMASTGAFMPKAVSSAAPEFNSPGPGTTA